VPTFTQANLSALTPQLRGDIEKEAEAKKEVTKLFLLHARGTINDNVTNMSNIALAKLSKGMEIILSTACAAHLVALSNLIRETCTTTKQHNCLNLRSKLVLIIYVSMSFSDIIFASNLSVKGATSLNNEASSINPSSFLPQKNACLIEKDRSMLLRGPRIVWMLSIPTNQNQAFLLSALAQC
jgi:hypothetical protein